MIGIIKGLWVVLFWVLADAIALALVVTFGSLFLLPFIFLVRKTRQVRWTNG